MTVPLPTSSPVPGKVGYGAGAGTQTGIASLTWGNSVFRFRTNPNQIWWSSELITHVQQTYGGRVVQILGCRLGELTVKVECGWGGWDYLTQVVVYLRDLLVNQRNGVPATFEYTTRGWKMSVYALSIPFQDDWQAVTREITLRFKIQEDISGIVTQSTLQAELSRLQEGIYGPGTSAHNKYNDAAVGSATTEISQLAQKGIGQLSGAGIGLNETNGGVPTVAPSGLVPGLLSSGQSITDPALTPAK